MKKIISLVLAISMALTVCIIPVNAKSTSKVWSGKADTSWYTGKEDSYDISTAEQLAGLATLVNSGKMDSTGIVINLTSDIVLNDTTGWEDWYNNPPKNKFTPIGLSGDPINGYTAFRGLFNGNGHTIRGLYVKNYRIGGLFGYLYGACVSGVIIKESVVIGYDTGKVEWINEGCYAGSIAGIAEGSVINQCENNGLVYSVGPAEIFYGDRTAYAGGIVGSMHTEDLTKVLLAGGFAMFGVFYNAAIFTDGQGGLIKNSGVVNCINYRCAMAICANSAYSGGIAGWGNNGLIQNCLNLSHPGVKVNNSRSGHIGQIAGGLYSVSMVNCYYWNEGNNVRAIGSDMKTPVNNVKREAYERTANEIMTKKTVDSLGTAFVYEKDFRPYLRCDLSKGSGNRSSSKSSSTSTTSSSSDKPKISLKDGKATIKWNVVNNATGYIIYQKKSDGTYKKLCSSSKNSVTINNISSGKKYSFRIKAKFKDGSTEVIPNGNFSFTA